MRRITLLTIVFFAAMYSAEANPIALSAPDFPSVDALKQCKSKRDFFRAFDECETYMVASEIYGGQNLAHDFGLRYIEDLKKVPDSIPHGFLADEAWVHFIEYVEQRNYSLYEAITLRTLIEKYGLDQAKVIQEPSTKTWQLILPPDSEGNLLLKGGQRWKMVLREVRDGIAVVDLNDGRSSFYLIRLKAEP
jgi:hypothetical protein